MAESGDISQGSGQTLQGSDPKVRKRVHWDPREGPLRSSDGRSLREAPEWMVSKEIGGMVWRHSQWDLLLR